MIRLVVPLLALGVACSGPPTAPSTEPLPVDLAPPATERGIEDRLASIVLQPGEAPAGSEYDPDASGAGTLQDLGLVDGFTVTPGFKAAYRSAFPDVRADPARPPPRNDVHGAISLAALFERPTDASTFLKSRFPDDQPIAGAEYTDPAIGDESLAVVTQITAERPRVASITWRRGNLYLFLNVYGDYPVEQSLRLASVIDARAVAVLEAG